MSLRVAALHLLILGLRRTKVAVEQQKRDVFFSLAKGVLHVKSAGEITVLVLRVSLFLEWEVS